MADSGSRGCRAGRLLRTFRGSGIRKRDPRRAQQNEEFTGPKENVQQTPALQIGEILRLQADLESFLGAFLDEGAQGGRVHGIFAELLSARVQRLESCVAPEQEVIQAESLLIQGGNRGA